MIIHVALKKKKPEPEAPAPIVPAASPKPPSTATPKPRRREAPPPQGPRPHMPGGDRGAYAEELDRMSQIPGMRNVEVTTSRTFRWNLRDPVDGRNYEYYYQDQGPLMPHWGATQRPIATR